MIEAFTDQDKMLVRYLFDELSEDEISELHDQMLHDEELFERAQVVEMNLIDSYVRDELTPEERDRFREKFLALPENRDKVYHAEMFHGGLRHLSERERPPSPWGQTAGWQGQIAGLIQRPIPAAALAALVLLIAATVTFVYQARRRASNNNSLAVNSAPSPAATAGGNLNSTTGTPPELTAGGVPGASPPQAPPATPRSVPANRRRDEIARNNSGPFTQIECLFCQSESSTERSSGDTIPITLGNRVKKLVLRHELLGDVPERETYGVTIKDRYNRPIRLAGDRDTLEAKLMTDNRGGKRRKFITVEVPVDALEDAGPYSFQIDEPNLLPQKFTIKRARVSN